MLFYYPKMTLRNEKGEDVTAIMMGRCWRRPQRCGVAASVGVRPSSAATPKNRHHPLTGTDLQKKMDTTTKGDTPWVRIGTRAPRTASPPATTARPSAAT